MKEKIWHFPIFKGQETHTFTKKEEKTMTILLPTNESLLLVTKGPQEQMKPNPRNLITRVDTMG